MMKYRGFTLIELMVTLAIVAILLTTGVPSFATLIKDNRLTTKTNELVTSLTLARSEAIKQTATVFIDSNNGTNWEEGWTVWVDADGDGNLDAAEKIRVTAAFDDTGITMSAAGGGRITYDPQGAVGATDTFTICDDRTGETGRRLSVVATGQVRLNRDHSC